VIAGLIGKVVNIETDAVVVDVNGVLYRVFAPLSVIQGDGVIVGHQVQLETHMIVREDSLTLYGFLDASDVEWFRTLLTVSGVGPRVALAMMSRFGADELASIVHREDVTLLSTVPGIGKKTASRILLELRGKVPEPVGQAMSGRVRMQDDDLVEALEGLGYSRTEAVSAASRVDLAPDDALEDRLLAALRELTPSG
jgi:Holliday junction DNA helicase RuvA